MVQSKKIGVISKFKERILILRAIAKKINEVGISLGYVGAFFGSLDEKKNAYKPYCSFLDVSIRVYAIYFRS